MLVFFKSAPFHSYSRVTVEEQMKLPFANIDRCSVNVYVVTKIGFHENFCSFIIQVCCEVIMFYKMYVCMTAIQK